MDGPSCPSGVPCPSDSVSLTFTIDSDRRALVARFATASTHIPAVLDHPILHPRCRPDRQTLVSGGLATSQDFTFKTLSLRRGTIRDILKHFGFEELDRSATLVPIPGRARRPGCYTHLIDAKVADPARRTITQSHCPHIACRTCRTNGRQAFTGRRNLWRCGIATVGTRRLDEAAAVAHNDQAIDWSGTDSCI